MQGHTTRPQWREGFRIRRLVKVPSTTMCLRVYWSRRKWSVIENLTADLIITIKVFDMLAP